MKNVFFSLLLVILAGHVCAQDKSANCIYRPVGSDYTYKGVIYYSVDKGGDPYVISFNIIGIENGRGEFYNRKDYPMYTDEKIGGVTYKYSMPINGSGQAFFNLICDKCR